MRSSRGMIVSSRSFHPLQSTTCARLEVQVAELEVRELGAPEAMRSPVATRAQLRKPSEVSGPRRAPQRSCSCSGMLKWPGSFLWVGSRNLSTAGFRTVISSRTIQALPRARLNRREVRSGKEGRVNVRISGPGCQL